MDVSNPESVSIKMEPSSQKEGADLQIQTDHQYVKKECLQYAESVHQTSSIKVETVPVKAGPGSREEDGEGNHCTEIVINFPDIKKECFVRSKSTTQHAASITVPKTNPGKEPFSCSHCNFTCSRNLKLTLHLRTHTGEKPFSCSHCNYTCSQIGSLKRHKLTHTGEKPFTCSKCSYSCTRKGNLEIHMRTHSGEKPYACSYCSYVCSDRKYLKTHTLSHTGEKPYSCSNCNYSCSGKGNLNRHMRIHSPKLSLSCSTSDSVLKSDF